MTIDIQWIRHHPDQVRSWQQCRELLPQATVVLDQVIRHDQASRQLLHTLRNHRQRMNSIAKELRTDRDNVALVQERAHLQELVQQLDEQINETKQRVQELLETLASPIDTVLLEQYPLFPDESSLMSSSGSPPLSSSWYQINSLLWTALEFFGQKYSTRHILPQYNGTWVSTSSSSLSTSPTTPTAVSTADWKFWVATSVPRKAIYGAKQLPQYTLLQDHHPREQENNQGVRLECLAMTAGSMWDSRQVQLELATELQTFYESLLSSISPIHPTIATIPITMYALPSHKLEQHELSRILLVAQQQQQQGNDNHYILGWVSNFGDAHSRANDIRFRGGGLAESKEFVYWVHATILGSWTWHQLAALQLLLQHFPGGRTSSNNHPNHDEVGLPAWATREIAAAGPAGSRTMLSPPRFTTRLGIAKKNHSSLKQSLRRMDLTLNSKSAETVSCPFGFLL